jgi:putative hydrolase of the HAD superfamily
MVGERFGVDPGPLQGVFFARHWPAVVVGRRAVEPALGRAIDELGWTMTVEELVGCWLEADFTVDLDVLEAVRGWADDGARLVLVTNQEHRRARYLEERLGALIPVTGIAYSAGLGLLKEDPAFYAAASARLGLGRGSAVLVDDAPGNVEAARRHGWAAVRFVRDGDWPLTVGSALRRAASPRPTAEAPTPRAPVKSGNPPGRRATTPVADAPGAAYGKLGGWGGPSLRRRGQGDSAFSWWASLSAPSPAPPWPGRRRRRRSRERSRLS